MPTAFFKSSAHKWPDRAVGAYPLAESATLGGGALSLAMAVSKIWLACNALTEPPASLCLCSTATLPALSSTRSAYASTWSQALLLMCRSETPTAECTQSSISHPLSRHHLAPTLRDVWSSACFLSECGR